jgi:hypothetical protein
VASVEKDDFPYGLRILQPGGDGTLIVMMISGQSVDDKWVDAGEHLGGPHVGVCT